MKAAGRPKTGDETPGSFYHGRIRVLQSRNGYRFSVDAPLLADFIRARPGDELLDLGTGCGIIPLLLSPKPFRTITAVEIQPGLAGLARRNVALNGLESRIEVVEADFRAYDPGRRFDIVFANPPYIRGKGGRLSDVEEKSIAKHEIKCDIFDIMRATRRLLEDDGRACFIYPERRRKDFLEAMNAEGLNLAAVRTVLPRDGASPNLFLAECGRRSAATKVLPPFILFSAEGRYTAEAEAVFAGRTAE